MALGLGGFPALVGLWLALTLRTDHVPDGGWIAITLAAAGWGLLAGRALAQSVILTADTLVIRNILVTGRVPLADLRAVGFRHGRLTVTRGHGAAASERGAVRAVDLGSAYWPSLRSDADAIAAAIADAAGLPPPPPGGEIISRTWAWILLLAAALCIGFGAFCGPWQLGKTQLPFAVREVGAALYPAGAVMLGLAFRVSRGRRGERTQRAVPGEWN